MRLTAARGHEDPERDGVFPETEGTSRLYTIREMARDFQVSIRTLRFYEDRGLLHPRREGINRRYNSRDRLHLKMILKGKSLGFTLSEIHDILAGREQDSDKMDLEMGLLPEQRSPRRLTISNGSAAKSTRPSALCARPSDICSNCSPKVPAARIDLARLPTPVAVRSASVVPLFKPGFNQL